MKMHNDRTGFIDIPPARHQRSFRVLLNVETGERAEHLIRRLIKTKRGNLLAIERCGLRRRPRLHLRLGERRIHDIIASLEAAGFAVDALVAT